MRAPKESYSDVILKLAAVRQEKASPLLSDFRHFVNSGASFTGSEKTNEWEYSEPP
jgi:predicted CopG family antitoxin